jgi:hypothetical protein
MANFLPIFSFTAFMTKRVSFISTTIFLHSPHLLSSTIVWPLFLYLFFTVGVFAKLLSHHESPPRLPGL